MASADAGLNLYFPQHDAYRNRHIGPGQSLFSLVRLWTRKPHFYTQEQALHDRLIRLCDAIEHLYHLREPATVNAIAKELGINQSGVSRLLKSAGERHYVELRSVKDDARQRVAILTVSGHQMLKDAHVQQEQVFEELTENWSEERRAELEKALAELVWRTRERVEKRN